MIGPVHQVFGEEVSQIDGFHVMQALNRGIRRDLLDYRQHEFKRPIRDLYKLRAWLGTIQQQLQHAKKALIPTIKKRPTVDLICPDVKECMDITQAFLPLIAMKDPQKFENKLHTTLKKITRHSKDVVQTLVQTITNHLPKRALTLKGLRRLKITLIKGLKKVYRDYRTALEAKSSQFYKEHWFIFFQPERLTKERKKRLDAFLTTYPQLQEYRQMTLQVGSIYRNPIESIDGTEIDGLTIKKYYSEKLQTAIKTLKKYKRAILRFVDVFQADSTLALACRANMEYYNQKFKRPFQHGLNCTKEKHLLAKLKLQLNCEVRFFVEKKTNNEHHKKLNA